jgi:hypothetical protein
MDASPENRLPHSAKKGECRGQRYPDTFGTHGHPKSLLGGAPFAGHANPRLAEISTLLALAVAAGARHLVVRRDLLPCRAIIVVVVNVRI